ncbi:hypothetical protein SNEBB_005020, partial [Seison nebaliae]
MDQGRTIKGEEIQRRQRRARLGQINKYMDQMETKMATPKPPIPELFRSFAKSNKDLTLPNTLIETTQDEYVDANESMEIPHFSELNTAEVFQFKVTSDPPIGNDVDSITVTQKTTDAQIQLCDNDSIISLSSMPPTLNDVILGTRNKRRRCNSSN